VSYRKYIALVATVVMAAAGCADEEADSDPGAGGQTASSSSTGGTGAGGSAEGACDGLGSCPACQACAYDAGGGCEGAVEGCIQNPDCVELNDCMTDCVGDDSSLFDGCRSECNSAHPRGESDYSAVLDCVVSVCGSDCRF
jgi:hypothetical protein